MVGYALNSHEIDQNTQKFNCHKLNEFQVGFPLKNAGITGNNLLKLFKGLDKKDTELTK